jgi:transcriptional regulator with XRE-family HTH domain
MSELTERLRTELRDREYREGYDEAFLDHKIATQIRVLREQRGLTQKQLAKEAAMSQSRISEMEDQDYGSWSINTLRRLAYAFGVRLDVTFKEWGDLLTQVEHSSREDLERASFEDDPAFHPKARRATIRTEVTPSQIDATALTSLNLLDAHLVARPAALLRTAHHRQHSDLLPTNILTTGSFQFGTTVRLRPATYEIIHRIGTEEDVWQTINQQQPTPSPQPKLAM